MPSLIAALNAASADESRPIDPSLERLIEAAAARFQAGEHLDIEQLIAAHPAYAEQLRELLPMVESLVRMGDTPVDPAGDQTSGFPLAKLPHGELGDFRLIREIGRGGMGTVYEAQQHSTGRRVALKVLPFASLVSERSLTRFKNEIRTAASLDHPHIASVFASGEERGVHFYAMQLIRGLSLAEIIGSLRGKALTDASAKRSGGEGKVDLPFTGETVACAALSTAHSQHRQDFYRRVADFGMQACDALHFAHEMGVVHRDVKPSNLLTNDEGRLWVADFGLALNNTDEALTMTGDLLGTLRYMSPEQAQGEKRILDPRTDIYSLGATIYELSTLHPPFEEVDPRRLLRQLADEQPLPPRLHDPRIPVDLETILLKALEKDPADRYQTARELGDDLRRFCERKPVSARKATRAERASRWVRRYPVISGLLSAIVVLSLAVAAAATIGYVRTKAALSGKDAAIAQLHTEQAASYQNLYVAQMHVAHEQLKAEQDDCFIHTLEQHLPLAGRRDLRGWEWYYLLSLCHRDLATFTDQGNMLMSIAWDPAGKRLAAAGSTGLFVVDPMTHHEFWSDRVAHMGMCWSPNGSRLATASWTNPAVVCVRDAETGRRLMELAAGRNPITSIAWSPDGSRIAAACCDGTCTLWEATTGKQLRVFGRSDDANERTDWQYGFTKHANFVAWSANNNRLITANSNQSVQIWDVVSGRNLMTLSMQGDAVVGMALSPNGRWVAIASWKRAGAGKIIVWDTDNGNVQRSLALAGEVLCLAFSPDNRRLAAGMRGGRSGIWDVETGQFVRQIGSNNSSSFAVAFSPDGRRLATGSCDGLLKIWDAFQTPDATTFNNERWSGPLILSPDGRRFAGGVEGGEIAICDIGTGEIIARFKAENLGFRRPAWSRDGRSLAWAAEVPGSFNIIDTDTCQMKCTLNQGAQVTALEFSPDGLRLASASEDSGKVKIWDVALQSEIQAFEADRTGVYAIGWHPDGSRLATIGREGQVRIWNSDRWDLDSELPRNGGGWLASLAWSPDGRRLAAAGWDRSVKVWDVDTGRVDSTRGGQSGQINSVAWLAGGDRIASTSLGGTINIWDTNSSDELLSLEAGTRLDGAACSQDGWTVATVSDEGLKLWNAKPGFDLAHSHEYVKGRAHELYVGGLLFGQSKESVQEARRLDPPAYWRWCRVLGQLALEDGDFETAVTHLTEALQGPPEGEVALTYDERGRAHHGLKQFEAAIVDFTHALAVDDNPEYYLHRADAYRDSGNVKHAIIDYTSAIESTDEPCVKVCGYRERGLCYLYGKNFAHALVDYCAAAQLDPDFTATPIELGALRSLLDWIESATVSVITAER